MYLRTLFAIALACASLAGCHTQVARPTPPTVDVDAPGSSAITRETSGGLTRAEPVAVTSPAGGELPTGRPCTVQFRRDALGMAGPGVLGPQVTTPPARSARLTGTLDRVTEDWLVVRVPEGTTFWIARDAVLLVEFSDGP